MKSSNDQTTSITITDTVQAPLDKVWDRWNAPEHITRWNFAADDWHCPKAANDLRTGGKFSSRMEARDGSFGFDFEGIYDEVVPFKMIAYTMSDGRKVKTAFEAQGNETKITTIFDAENENPVDVQQAGWQAILDNFKKYTEAP